MVIIVIIIVNEANGTLAISNLTIAGPNTGIITIITIIMIIIITMIRTWPCLFPAYRKGPPPSCKMFGQLDGLH